MKHSFSVAVFDAEDPETLEIAAGVLKEYRSLVIPCASEEALRTAIENKPVDVVILNLSRPFEQSFRVLAEIQNKAPQVEVIFVARFDDEVLWAWMEVIQRGAYEFLPKPFDPEELKHHMVHAAEKHHPLEMRKRPPAASIREFNPTSTGRASAAGT